MGDEIEPAHVDEIVLEAFEAALSASSFARHVQTIKRDVATLWNRLCDRLPDRKLRSLAVLSRRAKPKRVSLDSLPSSFAADLRAHLDWAAVKDPLSEEARKRPLAPRSLRLREQYVLSAVTALVKSGTDPRSIRSLADVIIPVSFKAILRQRLKNLNPRSAAYNESLAKALIAIAVEWVHPDQDLVTELKRLSSRVPKAPPGLTEKNKTVLREFSDPDMIERLRDLQDKLWRRAERRPFSLRTLADLQAALAISILFYAPLRISNLVGLQFGRTLHLGVRDSLVSLIDIPASEMKSGQPFIMELPTALTAKLRRYHQMLLAEYGSTPVDLFDNGSGHSKLAQSISWLIKRTIRRHLGVHMTAHQFRHVMGALVLEDEPSASSFETARQLLGHRNIATTVRHYTGQNTISAGRRHQALIEAKLAKTRSSPATRRRAKRGR